MPWADYTCPGCPGIVLRNHRFAAAVGAKASAPLCPVCAIYMEPIPACQFDLRTDGQGGRAFQKFDCYRQVPTREGLVQVKETIDSLHSLRRIERDSEQRFRDGEGEALRFRLWNQNASNRLENSFGQAGQIGDQAYDSGQTPVKSGKVSVIRHGASKPEVTLGPGVT
jgi:hypothetical protein